MTSVATLMMSAALFTRRSRSGWLDELDDIRDGALASPDGEVSSAMAGAAPLPESDTSPLAELEAPSDLASWLPGRAAAAHQVAAFGSHSSEPTGDPDLTTLNHVSPGDDAPAPPEPVEPTPAAPVAVVDVAIEALASEEPVTAAPSVAPIEHAPGAAAVEATIEEPRSTLPPPPPPPAPVGPASVGPAGARADDDPQPEPEPEPEPVLVQPSPHPIRPQEMWHPQVAVAAVPPRPEERLDPADLMADDASGSQAARFRFARLRAVTPEGGALVGADDDYPAPPRPPARRAEADLFGRERPISADEAPLGIGAAPLVPERPIGGGGALITGPVPRRRRQRDTETARGRRHDQPPTDADELEPETVEPVASALAAEPAWRWIPDEPGAPSATPAEPEVIAEAAAPAPEISAEVDATTAEAASTPAEPVVAVEASAGPRQLVVGPDGSVAVGEGILRVAEGQDIVVVEDHEGIRLDLTGGWCWADRPDGSTTVTITLAVGTLTLAAGTVALAVTEADGTAFVVVAGGEAQLAHVGGRLRLRAGALVLAPLGSEPKVDVAVGSEILSDPLVQHNLRLDTAR